MKSRLWRPLLDGDLAVRAWEAVNAVAQALEVWSPGDPREYHPESWLDRVVSLGGGAAGQALFHGYLFKAAGAERHAVRAQQLLNQAIEALAMTPTHPALYSGFTGVAWVAEHLGRLLGGEEERDYDLISGLVGFGFYALDRFPRPSAVRCLEATSTGWTRAPRGTGRASPGSSPPRSCPAPFGSARPTAITTWGWRTVSPASSPCWPTPAAWESGKTGRAPCSTARCAGWRCSLSLGRGGPASPPRSGPGIESKPSRLAWCYGDPGIAATLLYAARAVGMKEWEDMALAIAAHAANAAPEDAGVLDMGLCHGALGLAHLYNRIYQAGGDELFADAARLWYRRGLEMHKPEGGVAGIETRVAGQDSQSLWAADPGFLTGAAGIGLALLAAVTSVEPEWDHLLLVANPPREPSPGASRFVWHFPSPASHWVLPEPVVYMLFG